jgi:hypothetical protein
VLPLSLPVLIPTFLSFVLRLFLLYMHHMHPKMVLSMLLLGAAIYACAELMAAE